MHLGVGFRGAFGLVCRVYFWQAWGSKRLHGLRVRLLKDPIGGFRVYLDPKEPTFSSTYIRKNHHKEPQKGRFFGVHVGFMEDYDDRSVRNEIHTNM